MSNPFDLTAKSILVTGASSGIGKQSAITLSQQGAIVTITGRNEENLNQTFAALSGSGHQKIVADLTNETELAALIANAAAFDGIVLAAGIVKVLPFRFINKAEMKSIYAHFGLPNYEGHDFNNVEQLTHENDIIHGMFGDHKIQPQIKPVKDDYIEILGQEQSDRLKQHYDWYFKAFNYI